jgi:uncharacterized cupredoxin-like copper-binding protein
VTTTLTREPQPEDGFEPGRARSRNRDVFGVGTLVFSLLAMLFAFGALIVAGQAWSRSNDAKDAVAKVAAGGVVPSATTVTLQEYTMTPHAAALKAGTVRLNVNNVGSITHELVLVRAPSVSALPIVQTATKDRAVGDVNEEAIPNSAKMGETGDIKPGQTVVKTFKLTPGAYVMFCNIDNTNPDGTVLNHFHQGMAATITAQ